MIVDISLRLEMSSDDKTAITEHLYKYLTFRNLEELLNRDTKMQVEVHSKKFSLPPVILEK